jgi:hypothetical protein
LARRHDSRQLRDEHGADILEGKLGFNQTLVLVDKKKGSADRKTNRQDNWKMRRQVS